NIDQRRLEERLVSVVITWNLWKATSSLTFRGSLVNRHSKPPSSSLRYPHAASHSRSASLINLGSIQQFKRNHFSAKNRRNPLALALTATLDHNMSSRYMHRRERWSKYWRVGRYNLYVYLLDFIPFVAIMRSDP